MLAEKVKTLDRYVTDKGLRRRYYLYHCPNSPQKHLYEMSVPPEVNKSKFEWYGMRSNFTFPRSMSGKRVQIRFTCGYCNRLHVTNPKICKKCLKLQKPISKKLKSRLIFDKDINCKCHDTTSK